LTRTIQMLLWKGNHGLWGILAMLKPSVVILQLSEGIGLRVLLGVFIYVKNIIAFTELCVGVDFEMIAVEVKGMDSKYTWEITGIYTAPNDDTLAIERSAARNLPRRNLTKRSIIGGDLNLLQAVWKGDEEKTSGFQTFNTLQSGDD